MKILFIADVPEDPNSGAAGTEFQTMHALRKLGHDVDEVWADELPHRIKHGNLHYLLEQPMAYRKEITSRLARYDYDIIHANESAAFLAARYHRKSGGHAIFVCRSHGLELRALESLNLWHNKLGLQKRSLPMSIVGQLIDAGKERACRLAAKYADGHIISCSESRDFLFNRFNVPADHIACIPQAAPDLYRQAIEPISRLRMKRLLFVGPVKLWKGVHSLCEAWNQLALGEIPLELTWVCPRDEWSEASLMLSPAAQKRTSFIAHISQDKLMKLYDSHGMFLFPSLFEGFGKAPLEAMVRGLCVISSNTGGMRDVISNNIDGILIEPGNSHQLKSAILTLSKNWDMAQRISESARATALLYSWERVAHEVSDFYNRLIVIKSSRLQKGY